MALDKLTKIDGGGISTTSNYRVGVITATKFVGPIEGSITATDASFSGNVSIAGTLTYEDVTNVDSVGVITARTNILLGESLKHLGDENTLISFPANDTITAHTSGSERVRITSGGNVGIGTNSPYNTGLDVRFPLTTVASFTSNANGTQGADVSIIHTKSGITDNDKVGQISFKGGALGNATTYAQIRAIATDISDKKGDIAFYMRNGNNTTGSLIDDERVRITSDGKVGIGTAIPSSLLSLFSDADGEELLFFDMGSPADRRGWKFEQKDTGTGTQLNLKSVGNGKSFVVSDSSDNITLRVHTSSTGGIAYNGAYISLYPLVGIGQTLAHVGDTDTKLEFPANDTIKFDTNGSQRLRINSDGRVLIGNNLTNSNNETTGNLLVDGGDNNIGAIQVHAGGGENSGDLAGISFSHGVDGTAARPKAAIAFECDASGYGRGDLVFYVDNTTDNSKVSNVDERVRFKGNGLVGINTNNPLAKLNLYTENGTATGGILVQNVQYANNQNRPYLIVGTKSWTGATTNWNTYGFQHRIKTNSSGVPRICITTHSAEAFTLKNDGKIGINVTSPDEILHINGNFKVTGQIQQSTPADYWSQGNTFIELNGIGNITHMGGYELNITSNGYRDTNGQWVSYNTNSQGGAAQIGLTPTGEMRFRTDASKADGTSHNPTTRAVIDSSGRFLIGNYHQNSASSHADELQIINTSAQGGLSIINASNGQGNIYFGHSGGTADGRIEYSHQADYMRLFTANTERLRITSAGNVGIASASPSTRLDVFGTGTTLAQFGDPRSASFECIRIKNNEAGYPAISQDSSNDTLDLRSMGSVQATIDANNNSTGKYFRVMHNGQGNSGQELFKVADNGIVYVPRGVVYMGRQGGSNFIEVGTGQNANNYAYIDFIGDSTYTDYGLRLIRGNGGANTTSQLIHRGTGSLSLQCTEAAQIDFKTNGSNNRLSIEAGGNVGINTSNPDHRFHVYHPTTNTVAKFESGDAGCGMLFKDTTATTRLETYSTEFKIDFDVEGLLADSSRHINLDLNGTTKLSVHHEGVRIGNAGTPNQMLQVDGNIYLGPNDTNKFVHSGASLALTADSNIYFVCDSNDTSGVAPSGEFIWGGGSETNTNSNPDFTEAEFGNGLKPRNQYMYLNESTLRPTSNGGINLGSGSYRWGQIYSTSSSISTSDRNEKKEIIDCDLGLDFICKLNPVSFKWNTERNKKADTKVHYGLIAQDVEEVILSEGKTLDEFGVVDKSEEEDAIMGLSYSELIAPMIKALQEANEKIKILETEVAALKSL